MSERFAWFFDKKIKKKVWVADMWARKAVLAIRTAITGITSRLTTIENAGYQTSADVSAAIAEAIGGVTELQYVVVSSLPATGSKGVIYLVPHQHGTRDIYDEYIWANNAFEKIGNTDVDLSQYLLKTDISAWAKASTKPTYTASEVGALPNTTVIPSKTSQLTNDSGFITSAPVTSVNGKTGTVALDASDVGALPASTAIPSKTSDLTNDSEYITSADLPSVPSPSTASPKMDGTASVGTSGAWSRGDHVHPHDTSKADKATTLAGYGITNAYTKTEVDWMIPTVPTNVSAFTNDAGYITSAPVASVNGQTGAVNLSASDVGAQDALTVAQLAAVNSGITSEYVSSKFAVITCALASSNTYGAFTALPTGFTKDTCVMLVIQVPDGSGERIGQGIFTTTNMRLFAEMTTSGVRIYNNTSRYYGATVKVVLMRTDI